MDTAKYKSELLKLKEDLEESDINKIQSFKDSTGELSLVDNHPADVGDELFERSKDMSIRENNHMMLEKVNDALGRMELGNYGICVSCQKQIEEDRLEAVPYAAECVKCNGNKGSEFRRRPVEEDVIGVPFNRSYRGNDETLYDGEDSWQDVARYGTSDSAQDVMEEDKEVPYENSHENRGYVDEVEEIYQQDMEGHKFTNRKFKK